MAVDMHASDVRGSERTALLVLGMHRAGTSALARVLSLRGASLPERVMPPNRGNESGYWEPEAVVGLNERILDFFGVSWDDPFAASQLPHAGMFPARFAEEARAILEREYGDSDLFVLKDPRCTLLLDFWAEALRSIGVRPCPVVIMRPYREVADSLLRRDMTNAATAVLIYAGYGLEAAAACEAGASAVTYAGLVADWRATTDRIARELDITWPRSAAEADAEIEAFLHSPVREHVALELPADVERWASRIWEWFQRVAGGGHPQLSELEQVKQEIAHTRETLAPLLANRKRQLVDLNRSLSTSEEMLRQVVSERDVALAERDVALRVHENTEARLRDAEAGFQMLAQQRDALLSERDKVSRIQQETETQLRSTESSYRQAEAECEKLLEKLKELVEERDVLLSERDRALLAHRQTEDQLHRTEASYREMASEKDQLLQMQESKLKELVEERDMLSRRAADELQRVEAALARAVSERDMLVREIGVIHASRSWRVTAPLRNLGSLVRSVLRPRSAQRPPGVMLRDSNEPSLLPSGAEGAPTVEPQPSEPMFRRRKHRDLRHFLVAEFGPVAADDALLRIDRYRLPVESGVRAAAKISCTDDEALNWAAAMAHQASQCMVESPDPDVSIIIPVYNQLPFTLACIDALLSHATRYRFEILIGDDASSDATSLALATPIRGVRHVRHEANLGFVRNCNATAALARGRYVVMLNNDTQVLPGWLDELIGTLESNPDIGLAGSKLVFPDGRLQECGGIVWRDGSAWNFGRLQDPRRPEFCYMRDTDYVSGASIALPRDLWRELGGFDELFVPAYAEDVDLAFRIRARGLRTVVQPLSQLLHFEGISSGTDITQGAKAYQVENLKKLHERWQTTLQAHRDNADRPELEKERQVARRLLFIDLVTPTPNEDAGSLVALEMMKAFRDNGYKITFIPEDNFAHMGESTRNLQRIGIEAIYHPSYSSVDSFLSQCKDEFDLILLVRFAVGEAHIERLRRRYPSARIIFSNCDLHYLREMREAELSGAQTAMAAALNTKRRETDVIRRADVNLVHSEAELELLRRDVPNAPCVLFPLVHDPIEHCPPLAARDGLCFVGGYRHAPNADGIIWFVEKIWPLVLERDSRHTLYIAGSSMTSEVKALSAHPNVEVVGFVDDLEDFLAKRRVAIAPLRFGAGAKGKVAVSLANGVPVVSTSVGVEGMQLEPGVNALVADSVDEFAAHVLDILGNDSLWLRMSAAGLKYAADVTSRASARQRARGIIEMLERD